MKILVINGALKEKHKDMIVKAAKTAGASVLFVKSEDDIPEDFEDPEIIYGFGMKTAGKNKNLKWLCVPSAGVDYLLKPGIFANEECLITNSSGAYGVTIAEHIIAVSLMMMRHLTDFYLGSSRGEWGKPKPVRSLKGSRITVLGTGDIGCSFAKRVSAFEPESITGICRSGICDCEAFGKVLKTDDIDAVLPLTDLLVMSLPDTDETKNILSRRRIGLLSEGAYVVNVGRGSAIDEDALADSLESGKLQGAALDVFKTEPLPKDSRLWNTRNLIITPHIAGNLTLEHTLDRNVEMFCEDLDNYVNGRPLKNLIDRKKGY